MSLRSLLLAGMFLILASLAGACAAGGEAAALPSDGTGADAVSVDTTDAVDCDLFAEESAEYEACEAEEYAAEADECDLFAEDSAEYEACEAEEYAAEADDCDQFAEDSAEYEACKTEEYVEPDVADTGALGSPDSDPESSGVLTVKLTSAGGEYQTGTAVFRPEGDKTVVEVHVTPPMNSAQPIHMHKGGCTAALGPVTQVLQDVVNGQSSTLIDQPIGVVTAERQAINIHLSASDYQTSTACGVLAG